MGAPATTSTAAACSARRPAGPCLGQTTAGTASWRPGRSSGSPAWLRWPRARPQRFEMSFPGATGPRSARNCSRPGVTPAGQPVGGSHRQRAGALLQPGRFGLRRLPRRIDSGWTAGAWQAGALHQLPGLIQRPSTTRSGRTRPASQRLLHRRQRRTPSESVRRGHRRHPGPRRIGRGRRQRLPTRSTICPHDCRRRGCRGRHQPVHPDGSQLRLFWGLSIHAWGTMLIPDDAPFDRFYGRESGCVHERSARPTRPYLVLDLLTVRPDEPAAGAACFTEVGNFKRDPGVDRQARLHRSEKCTNPDARPCRRRHPCAERSGSLLGHGLLPRIQPVAQEPQLQVVPLRRVPCRRDLDRPYRRDQPPVELQRLGSRSSSPAARAARSSPSLWAEAGSSPASRSRASSMRTPRTAIERNIADFCTIEP